ncbi:glycine zipper family protein [Acidocella aromatica]|uniref:Glycine-zipper-containing OmpA-like membrane domain-containing protein n=1 Tax=Acidocella aromatica TaxID=1303579 RepID=A0A840VF66_9PROT|nr:glycine zipper family protein [Acidocella aromatica]MBB5374478.1 hypothetical protein [Acidocella aromatica]
MNKQHLAFGAATAALLLSGCAVAPPRGPSIMVLPGADKTYTQFQQDDYNCRAYAAQSIGYASSAASQVANQNGTAAAVTGTAVGAAAGALIGAAAGNPGAGAAIGAGTGLAVGATQGAANAQASAGELQWHYNTTYAQCMAAKGNKVPELPPAGAYGYPGEMAGYYYPYQLYPPAYAYYPGYGYLYPPVTFIYGFDWSGWHGGPHH